MTQYYHLRSKKEEKEEKRKKKKEKERNLFLVCKRENKLYIER